MWDRRTSEARGQLIIIGALSLAIILVGLALVLNSAIYAENVATRSSDSSSQVGELRGGVEGSIRGGAKHANKVNHSSYTSISNTVNNTTRTWESNISAAMARSGRSLRARYVDDSVVKGTRIGQNETREFAPKNTSALNLTSVVPSYASWTVSPDTKGLRAYEIRVQNDSLDVYSRSEANDSLEDITNNSTSAPAPPFTVVYSDGETIEHSMTFYEADTQYDRDFNITHRDHTTGDSTTCRLNRTGPTFTVDIDNARVTGGNSDCYETLKFHENLENPNITFVRGNQSEGTWQMVVNKSNSEFESSYDGNVYDHYDKHNHSNARGQPFIEPAAWTYDVEVHYESDQVSYSANMTGPRCVFC